MKTPVLTVKPNFIDRAIGYFAPAAGQKRLVARQVMDRLSRGYDGGKTGRLTSGWVSSGTSADAEIVSQSVLLRNRMRDLVRNNALAAQALQVLVSNAVGAGIVPRAASDNKALNKRVDVLWAKFAKECDFFGRTDVYGLQALAVREMFESGDGLCLKITTQVGAAKSIPLKLALKEIDHLDTSRMSASMPNYIDAGIEFDADGRRQAYWMFPHHPGSSGYWQALSLSSERIPAARVAHLFERQRVQNRGVPWGTPAMTALYHLGDWQEAELVRKKLEASLVAIVFSDDETQQGLAPTVVDSQGVTVEQFEPGLIAYSRGGKDVKFNAPAATGGVYEWNRVQMHMIAAGFRIPYCLMTGDLSQNNFASSRVGLNEYRRMITQLQWQTIIPMLCEPIWGWFIEACQLAGYLPMDRDIPAEWAPPAWEMVNPLQDVQADILETRAGFASPQQMIAKRGYDPAKVTAEWASYAADVDVEGLVFDSDPRKTGKAGQAQPPDGAAAAQTQP